MKVIETIAVAERELLAVQTEISILAAKFDQKSPMEDALLEARNKIFQAIKLNRTDAQKPQESYVYKVETAEPL